MAELWQLAKPFGRPRTFKNAEALWLAFLDYVTWSENNPIQIANERSQKNKVVGVEKMQKREEAVRPLSLTAFRLHAGIKRDWCAFKGYYSPKSTDFCRVLQAIEESIRQQQVDNALVGNYKENLVARLNNLAEVTKQEVTGNVTARKGMSVQEAREFLDELEKQI